MGPGALVRALLGGTLVAAGLVAGLPARGDVPAREGAPGAGGGLPAPAAVAAEVDRLLEAGWAGAGVTPAGPASDGELLRRLSLDVLGVVPEQATVHAFLLQRRGDRRQRLIRATLQDPLAARFMAVRWANELLGRSHRLQSGGDQAPLVLWLERQLRANRPWDEVVRELLAAEGRQDVNGAVQYLLRFGDDPAEMTGNAMRVFQGQQLQCAQCHDHPFRPGIAQRDFWGVAAFFARVTRREEMGTPLLVERARGSVSIPAPPGVQPEEVPPRFLTGEWVDPGPGRHLRRALAELITSPRNPDFVRATVNRVWSFYFGRGFVDPDEIDQVGFPQEAALVRLEQDFRASGHDLRRLSEVILLTRAYQLGSAGPEQGKHEQQDLFARARLRTLSPEQLWASFARATGVERARPDEDPLQVADRARQVQARFLAVFAQGDEELEQNTIPQALLLLNGPLTNAALAPGRPAMAELLQLPTQDERIMALFLRFLGRPASRAEREALRLEDASSAEQAQMLQDVAWALLNSSEFTYQH